MKVVFEKLADILGIALPFFSKKKTKEIREFSELIRAQYEFLVDQLERVNHEYWKISDKLRDMHLEILQLREELSKK